MNVLHRLSRLVTSRKAGVEEALNAAPVPAGFTPVTEFSEQDIFIVGYPKSGNTWFQNLAAGAAWGVIPEYAPPKLAQTDLVPGLHAIRWYKRYGTPMYFKSHHLPQPHFRRVVYLIRDGRDVMVSYFHYLKNTGLDVDFLELVRTGRELFPCKWHEHIAAWLNNPHRAEMLMIRYEDLKKQPALELARFCEFAGLKRDPQFLEMIASSADFAKLRQREETMGRGGVVKNWNPDGRFFRRGVVGSYRDEMPSDVLQAFLAEANPMLNRLGYA